MNLQGCELGKKRKRKDLFFSVHVNINKHEHMPAMCCQLSPIIIQGLFDMKYLLLYFYYSSECVL